MKLAPQVADDARAVLRDYLPAVQLDQRRWSGIEELVQRLGDALARNDAAGFEDVLIEIEQRSATRLPVAGSASPELRPTPPSPQLLELMNKLIHTLDAAQRHDNSSAGHGDAG